MGGKEKKPGVDPGNNARTIDTILPTLQSS